MTKEVDCHEAFQHRPEAGTGPRHDARHWMDRLDFNRPKIAVVNTWTEVTLHSICALWGSGEAGIHEAGGKPVEFNTIAVSDGIVWEPRMRASWFRER